MSVIPSWLGTMQLLQVQFPEPDTLVLSTTERSPREVVLTTTITWSRQPVTATCAPASRDSENPSEPRSTSYGILAEAVDYCTLLYVKMMQIGFASGVVAGR